MARIPFVQQLEASDCGAACLTMVLGFHGRHVELDEVRKSTGTGRGTTALALVDAAARFGLIGRGFQVEGEAFAQIPRGSILHWGFNHFVVLDRVRSSSVEIFDPSYGRRRVTIAHFQKLFTGVGLEFEPSSAFMPSANRPRRSLASLVRRSVHGSLVVFVLVVSLALRVLGLAIPLATGFAVDRIVPHSANDLIVVLASGAAIVLALQFIATLARAQLLIDLRTKVDMRMTTAFLDHMLSLPFAFFARRSAGDLMLRVDSNTQIREMLTSSLLSTLLDGGFAIIYLVLLALLSSLFFAFAVLAGGLHIGILLLARVRYRELTAQDLESHARSQSYLSQLLAGVETLKVSGTEARAVAQWSSLYVDELNIAAKRSRIVAFVDATSTLIQTGVPLALLALGAHLVVTGSMSLGTMLAAIALSTSFLAPLAALVNTVLHLQMLASHVERIEDVLGATPEPSRDVQAKALAGTIEIEQLSFRYSPDEPLVVDGVALTIPAGATIAIVGHSGSGKTTLAHLLLGLYTPTSGSIAFDGVALAAMDLRSLRREVGVVLQRTYLFAGSIANNICAGDTSIPMGRIVEAARRACVADDIDAMPMGYHTVIAEGGASLSGGQRQRLALARALVREPSLLVLDEATSALDTVTERSVISSLRAMRITQVVIAHRLSTIIDADMIVVMDHGRLVERGRHRELVARGGVYARLVADQTARTAPPGPIAMEAAP